MSAFVFSYVSICPAISIIISDKNIVNTRENRNNLYQWLNILFKLFNNSMKTDIYKINENDLDNEKDFFIKIFKEPLWPNYTEALKSPALWGKYIWSLMHIIALLWTPNNSYNVYYLIKNASDILPCEKCKTDYIKIFDDNTIVNQLNFIDSIEESVNFVLMLRQRINSKKYNLIPTTSKYDFVEIFNYLKPLLEPEYNIKKDINVKKNCNCSKKLK